MPTLEQIKVQLPEYLKNLLCDIEVLIQEKYDEGYRKGCEDTRKQLVKE